MAYDDRYPEYDEQPGAEEFWEGYEPTEPSEAPAKPDHDTRDREDDDCPF